MKEQKITSQSVQIGRIRFKLLHLAAYTAVSYFPPSCSAILFNIRRHGRKKITQLINHFLMEIWQHLIKLRILRISKQQEQKTIYNNIDCLPILQEKVNKIWFINQWELLKRKLRATKYWEKGSTRNLCATFIEIIVTA